MKAFPILLLYFIAPNFNVHGQEKDSVDQYVIFEIADTGAEPVGGMEAIYRWISDNISHEITKSADTTSCVALRDGKVYVRHVIDEQGRLIDPKIEIGIGEPYDSEALRLVTEMPIMWIPATKDGQNVKVRSTTVISFCTKRDHGTKRRRKKNEP
ncbi:outer membrane transport energization protein TonB [Flammeovirgaceae bacterium 311]|nr:outer membrane transport energization protein TonB [Flammeovirgaceae bacterium 311]